MKMIRLAWAAPAFVAANAVANASNEQMANGHNHFAVCLMAAQQRSFCVGDEQGRPYDLYAHQFRVQARQE
jgi:hypothetical protein